MLFQTELKYCQYQNTTEFNWCLYLCFCPIQIQILFKLVSTSNRSEIIQMCTSNLYFVLVLLVVIRSQAGNTLIDPNKSTPTTLDSQTNLLVNGNFQIPSIKNQSQLITELTGWEISVIEKGKGFVYNSKWGSNQVLELDAIENRFIRQKIKLSAGLYLFKMKYASKIGSVPSSAFSIFWNYRKVKQIYAIDQEINNFQLTLQASEGDNTLQIRGEGKSDGEGMTISNLSLQNANFIKNGDFKFPPIAKQWEYITNLPHWETIKAEKGKGSFYNYRWRNQQVIQLDSDQNSFLRQRLLLKKGDYVLQMKYASKVGYVYTSGMSVQWNGKLIKQIMSRDEEIHDLELMLSGLEGQNVIQIRGQGVSDHYGMCVTNIRLINQEKLNNYAKLVKQLTDPQNFIRNGDFRNANLKSDTEVFSQIPSWETKQIQIGRGLVYNFRWDSKRTVIIESDSNSFIRQKINLKEGPYLLTMKYAGEADYSNSTFMSILWNGKQIRKILSTDDKQIHTLDIKLFAINAQNVLQIRGGGAMKKRIFSITDIKLLSDLPSNYILSSDDNPVTTSASLIEGNLLTNGDFSDPPIQNDFSILKSLPYWEISEAPEAQKGKGNVYNSRWGRKQVLDLDGNKNYAISQKIDLKKGKYTFRMLYGAKYKKIQTAGVSIHWNGEKIVEIKASDDLIHEYQTVLEAIEGENVLMIRGEGPSDIHGMTIANLRLTKHELKPAKNLIPNSNLIKNSNFILPSLNGAPWKYFNGLASWATTNKIEKGRGKVYNFRWGNTQTLQLDAEVNYGIKQSFSLKKQIYVFRIRYAGKLGGLTTSAMSIHWNDLKIKQVYCRDQELHLLELTIQATEGENVLQIRGEGRSDHFGMSIGNLQLYSLLRPSQISDSLENINYLKNPCFLEPKIKGQFQYLNALQGWDTTLAQKGKGIHYNPKWGSNKYVLELDVNANKFIRQTIELNAGIYIFKLKHAARSNGKGTSAMQIIWNGGKIKQIIASDEEIHNLQLGLQAVEGSNTIQIRGSGKSDGLGMTISDLELLSANFIRNGNFIQPSIVKEWEYLNNIPYWETKIVEKGKGSFYNYRWNKTQVLELDAEQNYSILQRLQLKKGNYIFRFNYASKINHVVTSGLSVFWNSDQIYKIFPNDQEIHQVSLHIEALEGENKLQVKGQGPSDHYGITIGNLQLFKLFENYNDDLSLSDTDRNLIKNSNFLEPEIIIQKQILRSVPGWQVTTIQRGVGLLYNPRWGDRYVVRLDVNSNASIKQRIQLKKGFYKFGMEYIAKSQSIGFSLKWNGKKILQIFGKSEQIHEFEVSLVGIQGQNILQIRGEGTSDSAQLTIASLRLYPSQNAVTSPLPQQILKFNILKNWNFQLPALAKSKDWSYFDSLPDWQATRIKKSKGINYNQRWGSSLQIIQLLSKPKDYIRQNVMLGKGFYIFGMKYGAQKDCIDACGVSLTWNGNKILQVFGSDGDIHELQMSVSSIQGKNIIQIVGEGKSEVSGLAVASLRLNRLNQCPSYITF